MPCSRKKNRFKKQMMSFSLVQRFFVETPQQITNLKKDVKRYGIYCGSDHLMEIRRLKKFGGTCTTKAVGVLLKMQQQLGEQKKAHPLFQKNKKNKEPRCSVRSSVALQNSIFGGTKRRRYADQMVYCGGGTARACIHVRVCILFYVVCFWHLERMSMRKEELIEAVALSFHCLREAAGLMDVVHHAPNRNVRMFLSAGVQSHCCAQPVVGRH